MVVSRSNAPVGTARTQRNRKVSCEADAGCGFAVYVSRKQLARGGVWPCPACGDGRMVPVDPEDARLVLDAEQLESHPAVVDYRRAVAAAARAQTRTAYGSRYVARRSPDEIAADRLEADRREQARRRRLDALRRGVHADAREHDDAMPF